MSAAESQLSDTERLNDEIGRLEQTVNVLKTDKAVKENRIRELLAEIAEKDRLIADKEALLAQQKKQGSELIDKRFIASFIVNYLDVNNTDKVKIELLETLASLLEFTEADKVRIGLSRLRAHRIENSEDGKEAKKDLKSNFLSFLSNPES